MSPFDIEELLEGASPAMSRIVEIVNTSNDILYDVIVPTLFRALFEIEPFGNDSEEEIELVKGYNATTNRPPTFRFKAKPHLVAGRDYPEHAKHRDRTFHLDHYCFDSQPEVDFFKRVLGLNAADRIYFTGMLVHGQSGFRVNYIHPESHTVCNYYPDFLILRESGEIYLIEVKSAWKEDDPVVIAKREAAEQLASGNEFHYALLTKDDFSGFLSADGGWQNYTRPAMLT